MSESPEMLPPKEHRAAGAARAIMQAAGGAIPFAGGLVSAAAGAWGEHAQNKMNDFFLHYIQMLKEEMAEKQQTILEIGSRLNLQDEKIAERVETKEFQSLIRKAFRDWAGTESEEKRVMVRNIISNAAQPNRFVTDDVIKLFLQWIKDYSELHFDIVKQIYNETDGITRGAMWEKTGRPFPREDSAEADLFKTIIHDLSVGHIIRQDRDKDSQGRFLKRPRKRTGGGMRPASTMKSAFDDNDPYVLTEMGKQFVHYVMSEVCPDIGDSKVRCALVLNWPPLGGFFDSHAMKGILRYCYEKIFNTWTNIIDCNAGFARHGGLDGDAFGSVYFWG